MLTGRVAEFAEAKGLGTVIADDGTRYLFHVIEIADGTRTIDVGQPVSFQPLAKFGTIEAGEVRKIQKV